MVKTSETKGQVKIGREFFEKIKLDYADWRWALIREFLQNCFDAPGCKNVSVEIFKHGDDTGLSVSNDGAPMDRETLFGKLLTLGGSGKNFEGENTGGFGVAKSLLYYTHIGYQIRTGRLVVQGSGAEYSVGEVPEDRATLHGTESDVVVQGDEVEALVARAKRFAAYAQWKGQLKVNREVVETSFRKGTRRKDLGWGVIYTNQQYSNLCLVRLNGQPMFTRYCRYKGCVVVELNGKAKDVLTSNRDALTGKYDGELSDLLTALAVDKRSALREQRAEYRRYLGEKARNERKKPKQAEVGLAGILMPKDLAKLVAMGEAEEGPAIPGDEPTPTTATGGGGIKLVVVACEDEPDKTISLGTEFILKNTTGMKIPQHWTPGEKFSKDARHLVKAWVGCLLTLHKGLNVDGEFSVGFVFDDENEAEHEQGVYGRVYYINPVRVLAEPKRRMEARFESIWSARHEIVSLAAHELVHGLGFKEHDEDYAGKLTEVMKVALQHLDELDEACRASKDESSLPRSLRQQIMGFAMTAVVRWMGAQGWSFDHAWEALLALKCETTEASVRTFLRAGAKGERGDLPELTEDQQDELRNLVEKRYW